MYIHTYICISSQRNPYKIIYLLLIDAEPATYINFTAESKIHVRIIIIIIISLPIYARKNNNNNDSSSSLKIKEENDED